MARLSRDSKRDPAAPAAAPIDVHVRGNGRGTGSASVGDVRVVASAGEEVQHAVLAHLHRIALTTGTPVLATIHDERIGYVVPLRVDPDGASRFTAEPLRMAPAEAGAPAGVPASGEPPCPDESSRRDRPTHLMRQVEEPVRDGVPTFPMRAAPQAPSGDAGAAPTFRLRALPEPAQPTPPGTVAPPTGEFGPPPVMGAWPEPEPFDRPVESQTFPELSVEPQPFTPPFEPQPLPAPPFEPQPARRSESGPAPAHDPVLDPDPKPTPARGFDAVAEAVLGDETLTAPGDSTRPALLAESMAPINEAVKAGRTGVAMELAERTVAEASGTLGPEHPEVLRLRELTAYIAYLAGDPVRSFHLCLDLVRVRHRTGDAEAAYGNIQSAATAWRAVRDPLHGLDLGRDLIGLWSQLIAEDGPAADDIEELESARARMGRLEERARKSARPPTG